MSNSSTQSSSQQQQPSQQSHLSSEASAAIFKELQKNATILKAEIKLVNRPLSGREIEVVMCFCNPALRRQDVAEKLGISPKAVAFHASNIIAKLDATTIHDAVIRAAHLYAQVRQAWLLFQPSFA